MSMGMGENDRELERSQSAKKKKERELMTSTAMPANRKRISTLLCEVVQEKRDPTPIRDEPYHSKSKKTFERTKDWEKTEKGIEEEDKGRRQGRTKQTDMDDDEWNMNEENRLMWMKTKTIRIRMREQQLTQREITK
ncbi:hypothetical protein CHS0354_004519 [Potamilus streckersoni]|uniref:Uncharacterized protein n=1 Tax=Potamilus streckersoni TaxID=2493646 RepID=A0AAE0S5J0_9BIVA|nr:hypothetical protein CHS0354_004519 [Potamilus streckersoni]